MYIYTYIFSYTESVVTCLGYGPMCCSVLQRVAVCCSVLQCVVKGSINVIYLVYTQCHDKHLLYRQCQHKTLSYIGWLWLVASIKS